MNTETTQIYLEAARDAINALLADEQFKRVPELIELTQIPGKSKDLYEAIANVLSVQIPRDARDIPTHP